MSWRVIHGDCLEAMAKWNPSTIDAVVTDPPYGLEFMGKEWDRLGAGVVGTPADEGGFQDGHGGNPYTRGRIRFGSSARSMQDWHQEWAAAALRVLKPGGHLVAFGGTRTYHRLACALEDAGFEIRDCLAWLYGSGFPKSLDVSKAIDKAAGAEREVVGVNPNARPDSGRTGGIMGEALGRVFNTGVTAPATPDGHRWQGWGTALKPAFEPIVLARKPLEGTVAANVLRWGTGALNIDGARIGVGDGEREAVDGREWVAPTERTAYSAFGSDGSRRPIAYAPGGRWPANVILDADAGAMLDEQTGELAAGAFPEVRNTDKFRDVYGGFSGQEGLEGRAMDAGGASRFFYCPKADRAERNHGLEGFALGSVHPPSGDDRQWDIPGSLSRDRANTHPTVKPVDLMAWLCRLVTPPGGVILDPFAGSGSTGIAALREGFAFVGIEREADYVEIARARIAGDAPLFNTASEEAP